jgi:hypothetical protein
MNFERNIVNMVKCSIKRERDFMVLNTVSRISSFDYSIVCIKILVSLLLVSRLPFSHYGRNREHPKIGNSRRTHVTMHGSHDLKLCASIAVESLDAIRILRNHFH